MNGQTETVRLKVCSNLHTTRQIVNAARVQRATYNQAIEWQVNAGRALDADALKVILDNETAKGNPRVKNGDGNWQYGGLVRASSRFRGWMGSPNSMRTDGQVPYESTKRAECQGRVRCQAVRGITITNEGTLQIAGVGELEVVGGVRPRAPESVREVSIQETNTDTREGPSDPDGEREFVVLITFNVEQAAKPRTGVRKHITPEATTESDDGGRDHARRDVNSGVEDRKNRWGRRKNKRRKDSPEQSSRTNREGRPKGRAGSKCHQTEWECDRY